MPSISLNMLNNQLLPEVLKLIDNYPIVFQREKKGSKIYAPKNKIDTSSLDLSDRVSLETQLIDSFGTYTVGTSKSLLLEAEFSCALMKRFGVVYLMPGDPKLEYKVNGRWASRFVGMVIAKCLDRYEYQQMKLDVYKDRILLATLRDYNQRKK